MTEVLDKIHGCGGTDGPYWLDMESRVRDEDDWFDLNKVQKVLEEVYG